MKEIETQLAKKKNSNYLDRPYLIFVSLSVFIVYDRLKIVRLAL